MTTVKVVDNFDSEVLAEGDVHDDGSVTWTGGPRAKALQHMCPTAGPKDAGYLDALTEYLQRSTTMHVVTDGGLITEFTLEGGEKVKAKTRPCLNGPAISSGKNTLPVSVAMFSGGSALSTVGESATPVAPPALGALRHANSIRPGNSKV